MVGKFEAIWGVQPTIACLREGNFDTFDQIIMLSQGWGIWLFLFKKCQNCHPMPTPSPLRLNTHRWITSHWFNLHFNAVVYYIFTWFWVGAQSIHPRVVRTECNTWDDSILTFLFNCSVIFYEQQHNKWKRTISFI